jgi:hypothetical protein
MIINTYMFYAIKSPLLKGDIGGFNSGGRGGQDGRVKRTLLLKVGLGILSLLFCTTTINASEVQNSFKDANRLHSEQRYEEAAKVYEYLIDNKKTKNASVYYNLANSYYKIDKIGLAILNYEKALLLAPRDKEIKENLAIANAKTIDAIKDDLPFVRSIIKSAFGYISYSEISNIYFYFLLLMIVLLIIKIRITSLMPSTYLYIVFILFIISSMIFGVKYYGYETNLRGIVVIDKVSANSGPGQDFQKLFDIHEGTKVKIVKERNEWIRVVVNTHRSLVTPASSQINGWLPKDSVSGINPLE